MCCSKWVRFFLFVLVGVSLIVSSLISTFLVPTLVEEGIREALPLLNSSKSKTFEKWANVPLPIINRFYLFNVTNAEDIVAHQATPNVQELGPYTFEERREKVSIQFNDDETVVSYQNVRRYFFRADLTNGSLEDVIVHLNVPMIGSGEYVFRQEGSSEDKAFLYFAVNQMANLTGSILFPSHTAAQLLFDGYTDELMDEAAQLEGFKIPFDKFAWFYGRNGTSGDGLYSVFTGKDGLEHLGQMSAWNGSPRLDFDGSCGSFEATSAADFQPPFSGSSPPSQIKVFVGDICRSLTLDFVGVSEFKGVTLNRYEVGRDLFNYDVLENRCFCEDGHCPKNGVHNTSSCTFDSPSAVSMAHFLNADPIYHEQVSGLEPNDDKHGFFMNVHPTLGIAGQIAVRMQVNVVVRRDESVEWTKDMKVEQIYYPVLWFEATAELDDASAAELRMLDNMDTILLAISVVLFAVGLIVLVLTLRAHWGDIMFKVVNKSNASRAAKRATKEDAIRESETRAFGDIKLTMKRSF